MKALVVDEPWIGMILAGRKTWEMRSTQTSHRGWFGLIRKGSGEVVGAAQLADVRGPLSLSELDESFALHRVPIEEFRSGRASKWNTAWILEQGVSLPIPVRYHHPAGAVVWVNLSTQESELLRAQIERLPSAVRMRATGTRQLPGETLVPVARDGTWFHPGLIKAGEFTIGEKGAEQRVPDYYEALRLLASMSPARWRRPNGMGNWGIVSGVRWLRASDLQIQGELNTKDDRDHV